MDEMGSEESFQDAPAIQVPVTGEERLLRRLGEVERFVANITAELQKSKPCKGAISRELMERELGALNRDRESIQKKLGLVLSSFAVAPKEESYQHKHGDSPPDITPLTNTNGNISSSARVRKGPERPKERHPPSVAPSQTGDRNEGDLAPHKRKSSSASSGHEASNAPPSSSPPEHRKEVPGPDGGDGGGGREVFPGGGPRTRRSSSALGERDQYSNSVRQGDSGRRESAPCVQREVVLDADQRQQHPQQHEHRPDQPGWAVMGSRARGREGQQYRVGVGEPVQTVGAIPPPEGFFDEDRNRGHFSRGPPDGVFRGRCRSESQVPERGASRTINQQEQGGAGSSNRGRAGTFRAPKISSLIHSNPRQQYAPPAHDPPPTHTCPLRGTPRQFEGGSSHHGDGDREGLVHERDRLLKRRPIRQQHEETSGTSGRAWRAAPPAWPVETGGSEAGARGAYGSARVSVPVAMTVDNHHIDRPRTDSQQSAYHGVSNRHVDTSHVLDNHRAGPGDLDRSTKRSANNTSRYLTSNSSNQRYEDSSNTDYNWAYGGNGNRAVDTNTHVYNRAYRDNSSFVNNDSRQTPPRSDNVESRSRKRGRWYQQGQERERGQRYFQAGGAPRYSTHLVDRVAASTESSGWARGKLNAYSLTAQSPTH